jgi:hypothetical protein
MIAAALPLSRGPRPTPPAVLAAAEAAPLAAGAGPAADLDTSTDPFAVDPVLDRIARGAPAPDPTADEIALERQRAAFDAVAAAQAEREREIDVLRTMAMTQIKQDDEILKKWIEMI